MTQDEPADVIKASGEVNPERETVVDSDTNYDSSLDSETSVSGDEGNEKYEEVANQNSQTHLADAADSEQPVAAPAAATKSSLLSRVRGVLPAVRISKRVVPASDPASANDPAPNSPATPLSKGMRLKRAVKRVQIVKGLASTSVLKRIREDHTRNHGAVMRSLSVLLSSDRPTAELARLTFDPDKFRRELARLQREHEDAAAAASAIALGRKPSDRLDARRPSVEEYILEREATALREREAHRALLGFGRPPEEFLQSVRLLDSPTPRPPKHACTAPGAPAPAGRRAAPRRDAAKAPVRSWTGPFPVMK